MWECTNFNPPCCNLTTTTGAPHLDFEMWECTNFDPPCCKLTTTPPPPPPPRVLSHSAFDVEKLSLHAQLTPRVGAPHLDFRCGNARTSTLHAANSPRQRVPHISILRCGNARTSTLHAANSPLGWVPDISILRCGNARTSTLHAANSPPRVACPRISILRCGNAPNLNPPCCNLTTTTGAPHLDFEMWESTSLTPPGRRFSQGASMSVPPVSTPSKMIRFRPSPQFR